MPILPRSRSGAVRMTLRTCSLCLIFKPEDDFYLVRSGYRNPKCKVCCRRLVRDRYHDNRQKHLDYQKRKRETDNRYLLASRKRADDFYRSIEGRARHLHRNARRSPAAQEFPFTLTLEHVVKGIERGYCAVTNLKFDLTKNTKYVHNPYAPSIDRIDQKGPYSDLNTRIVIWQYNCFKSEMNDFEAYLIAKAFVNRFEGLS